MTRALIAGITGQDGSYLAEARQRLGWRPRVGFHESIRRMVGADLELL